MINRFVRLLVPVVSILILALAAVPALAQTAGSTSLSGVVVDSGGGVIPGANVIVKNNATGTTNETVSNSAGAFSVPGVPPGTYTVTVSLEGFKTSVINDVRLLTSSPGNIKAVLEVGALTETVEVRGGTELVQTHSAAVTSTLKSEQLTELPLASRNTLYATTFLPGVETTYGANSGARQSTFSGLPTNTINVTIDGITTGNQLQSGDGFFSMVTPRLDAVEEVTVTGAVPGSGGGAGAVRIAFTTRSGTNNFVNSIYHYFRHPDLNSNYYFNKVNNLDKNEVVVHQYGGRSGGPIVIPGLFDGRSKAFYFFNFEHQYQPSEATRTRTILNPQAEQGVFTYTVGGQPRTVNLLQLAGQSGHLATLDPTVASLLNAIRQSTTTTGTVNTPANATNTQQFVYQSASKGNQYAPTGRVDFNLTDAHRLTGTYYWQRFIANPDLLNNADPRFPGFPNIGIQQSYRTTGSVGLRSTLGSNLVNEAKGGWQWSPQDFFGNVTADMFGNQGGFNLTLPLNLTSAANVNNPAPRNTVNWSVENTLNWLKGRHSFQMGGLYTEIIHQQNNRNAVPTISFGVDQTNDPANSMFNTTNFPGASTANLNDARNLYALLTGRVTQIAGTARLNPSGDQYVYLGNLMQESKLKAFSLYGQDSWRVTPALTLNFGLRYEVQLPFSPITNTWSRATLQDLCGVSGVGGGPGGRDCNLFQPGNLGAGADFVPTYQPFAPGSTDYQTDWNNFAPNVGVAWRPNVENGWLRTLLGDPEQATLRAGYSKTFSLERMDRFTSIYAGNPGGAIAATRNYTTGFPMGAAPVLLREANRLGPPAFAQSPTYPIAATPSDDLEVFANNIVIPSVHSYSVGFQRSLGRDSAIEIRYVGNRNQDAWTTENWNELVLFENGFFDEFRRAQNNLRANIAAGRGATFAYTGAAGTSPLPIYLAYFQGLANNRASDPSAYTSGNFSSSSWTGHLGMYEPDPEDAANDLHANTTFRTNAINAGLPSNFFVMNPAIDDANITRPLAGTRYNAMQIDFRRRLSQGLLLSANYTYARSRGSSLQSLRFDRIYLENTDVPHSFKMNWVYEIPVGRGRRFGSNMNGFMNALLGGWEYSGTGRLQRQRYGINGGTGNDDLNLRLVGMTMEELQDAFKIRIETSPNGTVTVFSLPQDIIDNTRRAFNTDPTSPNHYGGDGPPTGRYIAPASGPDCVAIYAGDCGGLRQISLNGPLFTRFDMRIKKQFPLWGRATMEFDFEVLNVFDNINFNHQFNPGGGNTVFQVTNAYTDINTTFDPGGRLGQIAWRINW